MTWGPSQTFAALEPVGRDDRVDPRDRLDTSLAECVTHAVRRYFLDMGDHPPRELMGVVGREVETALLAEIMNQVGGTQSTAAAILGISRSTLRKKLRQYALM